MCGHLLAIDTTVKNKSGKIIKEALKGNVNEWIMNQYEDQLGRGTQGFGIIFMDEENNIILKRATEPIKFLLDLNLTPATKIIAHHRTPTSTDNKMDQTHPILVDNDSLKFTYLITHNGVIRNSDELRKKHNELGYIYTTDTKNTYLRDVFNDSESIAIETARFIEKQSNEIAAEGSMVVIALQINKKTGKAEKIFFFRNGGVLNMSKSRGKLRLSSEGEGSEIEENVMYACELDEEMKLLKRTVTYKIKEPIKSTYQGNMGFNTEKNTEIIRSVENNWGRNKNYNTRSTNIEKTLDERTPADEESDITINAEEESGLDGYLDKEKEEIGDIVGDFCTDMENSPETVDINQTIGQITEILERIRKTIEQVKAMNEVTDDLPTEDKKIEYLGDPKDFIKDSIKTSQKKESEEIENSLNNHHLG